MKRLLHFLGFHTWMPTPQTFADYIWGFRTWVCTCGKKQTRRETKPDNPLVVLEPPVK